MASEGFDAVGWAGVILGGLGVAGAVANFAYCEIVRVRTHNNDVKRDEFNTHLRSPLVAKLDKLRSEAKKLRALEVSWRALSERKNELNEIARSLTEAYEDLADRLEHADRNELISGSDWCDACERHWEACLNALNGAANPDAGHEDFVSGVRASKIAVGKLLTAVEDRISGEAKTHQIEMWTLWRRN